MAFGLMEDCAIPRMSSELFTCRFLGQWLLNDEFVYTLKEARNVIQD